jgi:hypothetical protein
MPFQSGSSEMPSSNEINCILDPSGKLSQETAVVDFASGSTTTHPTEYDLSSINVAVSLVSSLNADISVGHRINARQATFSRVLFDEHSVNKVEVGAHSSELLVDSLPSNQPRISDSYSATENHPASATKLIE